MPISATLGVSLVGRKAEKRAGWEEQPGEPCWLGLPAQLSILQGRRLGLMHRETGALSVWQHSISSERREHPITSCLNKSSTLHVPSAAFIPVKVNRNRGPSNFQESVQISKCCVYGLLANITVAVTAFFRFSLSVKGTLCSFWPLVVLYCDVWWTGALIIWLCLTIMGTCMSPAQDWW